MQDTKTLANQALNTLGSALNDYVKVMEKDGHGTAAQILASACQQSSKTIQGELNRLYKVEEQYTQMMGDQLDAQKQAAADKDPIEGEVEGKGKKPSARPAAN